MMSMVADATAVLASALLLVAGTSKLGAPWLLSHTLARLRPGTTMARTRIVLGVGAVEVSLAVLIVVQRSMTTTILVLVLAVVFATAGILGLRRGGDVPCNCFGSVKAPLGWPQIALIPFWVVVAFLPLHAPFGAAPLSHRVDALTAALLLAALVRLIGIAPAFWQVASMRRALGTPR